LRTDRPNMGSVLKGLGYTTAYFGKFELNKQLLKVNPAANYHAALQPYGFDFFNFDGDKFGSPDQGYQVDRYYSSVEVRWLSTNLFAHKCLGIERKRQAFLHGGEFNKPARHHVGRRQHSGPTAGAEGYNE